MPRNRYYYLRHTMVETMPSRFLIISLLLCATPKDRGVSADILMSLVYFIYVFSHLNILANLVL
jgi:hypothetical protein